MELQWLHEVRGRQIAIVADRKEIVFVHALEYPLATWEVTEPGRKGAAAVVVGAAAAQMQVLQAPPSRWT